MIDVVSLPVGDFQANCILLVDKQRGEAIVVDPGAEADVILETLDAHGAKAVAIWLTHAHIDHVGALAAVQRATGAPATIHPLEEEWLRDPTLNLAAVIGMPFETATAEHRWTDGEEVQALGVAWRVLHVPGHSPGLCAFVCASEKIAVVGDLVFAGSIGRMDLPGGSEDAMARSLRRFFDEVPGDCRVYPGHGPATTVATEARTNMLVREMMGG